MHAHFQFFCQPLKKRSKNCNNATERNFVPAQTTKCIHAFHRSLGARKFVCCIHVHINLFPVCDHLYVLH